MASQYKLTYLNITGFGEQIRYLFSYGEIKFEDNRIDEDKWPAVKPSEFSGKEMCNKFVLICVFYQQCPLDWYRS